jgi:hypothetical protein
MPEEKRHRKQRSKWRRVFDEISFWTFLDVFAQAGVRSNILENSRHIGRTNPLLAGSLGAASLPIIQLVLPLIHQDTDFADDIG